MTESTMKRDEWFAQIEQGVQDKVGDTVSGDKAAGRNS